jgi:hypothetical protein
MRSFIICTLHHIILRMRWEGHISLMEGIRNAYRIFVGRPEKKKM